MAISTYLITFDDDGNVTATRVVSTQPAEPRTVQVQAKTINGAIKAAQQKFAQGDS